MLFDSSKRARSSKRAVTSLTNIVCVTRNADLDATEGAEEQGEDYREHMKGKGWRAFTICGERKGSTLSAM